MARSWVIRVLRKPRQPWPDSPAWGPPPRRSSRPMSWWQTIKRLLTLKEELMALLDKINDAVTALEAVVPAVVTEVNTLKGNSADPAAADALAARITAATSTLNGTLPT